MTSVVPNTKHKHTGSSVNRKISTVCTNNLLVKCIKWHALDAFALYTFCKYENTDCKNMYCLICPWRTVHWHKQYDT